jgi:hypothetical protein
MQPARGKFLGAAVAVAIFMGSAVVRGQSAQTGSAAEPQYDKYQRSGDVFYMKRMGESGWQRGQEIWYMKCWICHNDYTREANDPSKATVAPTLRELYKRPMLLSGQPVNDDSVKAKIRAGGPGMPGYQYVLSDKDLNDLVEYLREKCCWDADTPPPNPRFKNPR